LFFNLVDSERLDPVGPLPEVDKGTGTTKNILVKYGSFTKAPDGTYADLADGYRCKSYLNNFNSTKTQADLHLWNQGGSGTCEDDYKDTMRINVGSPQNATATPDPNTPPPTGNGPGVGTEDKASCESSGFSLAWIVCPVINMMASAVDGIYSNLIEPLLVTKPLSLDTGSSNANYQVWSSFRIIGDIFLVIALLVIVFGQSIGGGLIDAYSAKKILPRILAAAILINLSYYIVALAVDFSNIIGGGIQNLILSPFKLADSEIRIGGVSAGLGIVSAVGAAGGGIWAIGAAGGAGLVVLDFLPAFLLFILLPFLLTVIAILAVVILRQGLILLLVLLSPIAFALYCLPNTEQYFKKWWDLLLKTLLVYPIIAILFAMGNVFAITITRSQTTYGPLTALLGIVALFVPLFLIPFAFKLAGGVLGRVHDIVSTGGKRGIEAVKGNVNDASSFRNRAKDRAGGAVNRTRVQAYRNMKKSGRAPGAAAFMFGSAIEQEAARNAKSKQRIFNVKDNGDDAIVNAAASFVDTDGVRKTLDGKTVKAADWKASQMLYPTLNDKQTVADYRSTKVNSTEEAEMFARNFGMMASQNGMTLEETGSAFTALAFARQNERGEWKHGRWTQDDITKDYNYLAPGAAGMYGSSPDADKNHTSAKNFVHEQYHKKGSFDASRALSSQFVALGDVKRQHVDEIKRVQSLGGAATQGDIDSGSSAKEELRKVLEIQDAWGKNAGGRDPATGDPIVGISGANSATIAAYNQLINGDSPPAPPGGTGPRIAPTADQRIIGGVKSEIDQGETWEALNNGRPIP
ncbi:MAG: hypothetical protein ABIV43_01260, partial [Candidatus Saccharimonadales bacterium]